VENEGLIKRIEDAIVHIPTDVMEHGTPSEIPHYYVQGILAGRKQAIKIINEAIDGE